MLRIMITVPIPFANMSLSTIETCEDLTPTHDDDVEMMMTTNDDGDAIANADEGFGMMSSWCNCRTADKEDGVAWKTAVDGKV